MPLTKKDLKAIGLLMETVIGDLEVITKSEISHLPTKEEFYFRMDQISGELESIRQEKVASVDKVHELDDRVTKVESNLGINQ